MEKQHEFTIVYCRACGWRSETFRGGVGGLHQCPECANGTHFVHYNRGEEAAVERTIDGVALFSIAHPPGLIDALADAIRSGKLTKH